MGIKTEVSVLADAPHRRVSPHKSSVKDLYGKKGKADEMGVATQSAKDRRESEFARRVHRRGGCSLYAIFIAHTMNPVSYRLVENDQNLRTIYGRYQEIYNTDGLVFTLAASCVAFAIAWCAVRGIAFTMTGSEAKPRRVTMRQRIPES